tara:strand:- start:180 stop:1244 length:1065 start_codon:yes stop_codon:yes gene_type:complete
MFRNTLAFDDVLLVPKRSDIESRKEIDTSSTMGNTTLALPVLSSPMDTVTETRMTTAMDSAGGMGIVHRYNTTKEQCSLVRDAVKSGAKNVGAAVGVTGDYVERALALHGSGARNICIDVAHGHHSNVETAIKKLKDVFAESATIIAGNVATPEGYYDLSSWGADAVRVGIGGGSICSTRIQTGHGVPTLWSVLGCAMERDVIQRGIREDTDGVTPAAIIADGGIKTAGDIVKALAAGANFVMLGSMLAGTTETPGSLMQSTTGKSFKSYRGMASREAQEEWKGVANSLEGVATTVPYKGPVELVLSDIAQNIRSGLSYTGARNIGELQLNREFVIQTSASQVESSTHIMNRNL